MYKKSYITLLLSASALLAHAQDLHKEITVERTVQPELRESFRLGGIVPEISMPPISARALQPAEYSESGTVTHDAAILPPAPWSDSIPLSPYRGYVSVGYLPLYNAAGSAGYSIINRSDARLNIWGQADGYSYTGDIPHASGVRMGNVVASAGADGAFILSDSSHISVGLKGMGAVIRTPYAYLSDRVERTSAYYQRALSIGASVGWTKRFDNVTASFGGGWENFRFLHNIPSMLSLSNASLNEKVGVIKAGIGLSDEYTGTSWLGADIDWTILQSNFYPRSWYTVAATVTEGHIRPYLNFDSENIKGSIGVNLSIATGNSEKALRIAPVANIAFDITRSLSLWARATGGEHLNPMSAMFQINPYTMPDRSCARSNVPIDIRGGFNYGPASGVTLEINAGYASARSMPTTLVTVYSNGYMNSRFAPTDFKCWYVGGRIAYAYGSLLTAALAVRTAGADNDINSWYEWYDGAGTELDASVNVYPVERLDIGVQFLMRTGRKGLSDVYPYNSVSTQVARYISDLGDMANLNLNGNYRVNDRLTVFAAIDNILGKQYMLISGMPSRKLGGLIGVSCQF